ncbi:hypothetical protein [Streptomyces chrestomyceticus]
MAQLSPYGAPRAIRFAPLPAGGLATPSMGGDWDALATIVV